jgi:hypothetical protein
MTPAGTPGGTAAAGSRLRDGERLLARLRAIHEGIRDAVLAACTEHTTDQLSSVAGDEAGDTIFAIDRVSEAVLLTAFEELARDWPCLLVAEGLGVDGRQVLPRGARLEDAEIAVLVDPIDGTRGLMYQKRPAWILTGVAPLTRMGARPSDETTALDQAPAFGVPTLADIELAVQTEIPLVKQHLSDVLWARAGQGAEGERFDRLTGARRPFAFRPSRAPSILQGFGGVSRFFPGGRDVLAAIDDQTIAAVLGPAPEGRAQAFEDQYLSSAGQLYELMVGHDRWIADLRPRLGPTLRARGLPEGLCCHPYDLACELIAREAGVIVTDLDGGQLTAPFDVSTGVGWVGYANAAIRAQIEGPLRAALARFGMGRSAELR